MITEKPNSEVSDLKRRTRQTLDSSRRSFAKAGVVAPVIMSLASKSVLGAAYNCTTSGIQSGNQSGNHTLASTCAVENSPGGWRQNADSPNPNSTGGALLQWLKAGVVPFSITTQTVTTTIKYSYNSSYSSPVKVVKNGITTYTQTVQVDTTVVTTYSPALLTGTTIVNNGTVGSPGPSTKTTLTGLTSGQCLKSGGTKTLTPTTVVTNGYIKSGVFQNNSNSQQVYTDIQGSGLGTTATPFNSIFTGSPITVSVWDQLDACSGSTPTCVAWDAIPDYLNAKIGNLTSVSADEIVSLYILATTGKSFTLPSGQVIDSNFNACTPTHPTNCGVQAFLASLHT